jgi:hypothetical protein
VPLNALDSHFCHLLRENIGSIEDVKLVLARLGEYLCDFAGADHEAKYKLEQIGLSEENLVDVLFNERSHNLRHWRNGFSPG